MAQPGIPAAGVGWLTDGLPAGGPDSGTAGM